MVCAVLGGKRVWGYITHPGGLSHHREHARTTRATLKAFDPKLMEHSDHLNEAQFPVV